MKRPSKHLDEAPVTAGAAAERELLLNASLGPERDCVLRDRRHHSMARGIHPQGVAQAFSSTQVREQGGPTPSPRCDSVQSHRGRTATMKR